MFLLAEVVIKKVAYKYILQILFPFYSLVKVMFGLVAYATERSYCLQICQHLGNCEACGEFVNKFLLILVLITFGIFR